MRSGRLADSMFGEESDMAKYLIRASYTAAGWAAQVKRPTNRLEALRPVVERLGGTIEQFFYSFGDHDVVAILDMPNHVSAAAWAIAGTAGGAVKNLETTPLLTVEEGIDALRKASDIGYSPPAG